VEKPPEIQSRQEVPKRWFLRDDKIIGVVCLVWCVGSLALFTRRTSLLQLLSLPLALLFFSAVVASVVRVFTNWRQRRWHSLVSIGMCVSALLLSFVLVRAASHLVFVWALPSYEAVIGQMQSGTISVPTGFTGIAAGPAKARFVYAIFAEKGTNGVLMVEFDTESGFPVKHSGYLYSSSGKIEPGSRMNSRWPIRRELRSNWFYVSN
jgi:hypothetical protein